MKKYHISVRSDQSIQDYEPTFSQCGIARTEFKRFHVDTSRSYGLIDEWDIFCEEEDITMLKLKLDVINIFEKN